MRIPGLKTAKAITRWAQARLLGGAMILGYHRVAAVEYDHHEVCVHPQRFAEQMEALRKYAHPISLWQLVQHLKNGTLPAGSIAVTFDDGYADNLYQAKPILEKYEIPATVFVCTGFTGSEFWWDELDRLVMTSQAGRQGPDLQLGEKRFKSEQPLLGHEAGRKAFSAALYQFLLPLDPEQRERAMQSIRSWAGVETQATTAARSMDHAELLQLADGGLVDLGAHTHTHPMLPLLSVERQRQEITSSRKHLEAILGKPVLGFAYPNGRATSDAKRLVKEAGFAYACTSLHNVVRPGSDMYDLTRFWQRDVSGEDFLRGLRSWMKP